MNDQQFDSEEKIGYACLSAAPRKLLGKLMKMHPGSYQVLACDDQFQFLSIFDHGVMLDQFRVCKGFRGFYMRRLGSHPLEK